MLYQFSSVQFIHSVVSDALRPHELQHAQPPYRRRQWHPTPVRLPGKSHGRRSPEGCSPWGREELDKTERRHFHFHALEKEMATHSSVLAWRIPGTGEPGGLPCMGSHRVGHNWSNLAAAAGLPVHHQLPEFTQTHVQCISDAIQPSHPLSSPFPPAPNPSQHQSLFQWVNSLHEVAKVLKFQL